MRKLEKLKPHVDAVSTDLWWNQIEYVKDSYDWTIAKNWLTSLRKVGLRWVPIISLHSCGHNVNDNFTVRLPKYVEKYLDKKNCFMTDDGYVVKEYVSFWNHRIYERYRLLLESFHETFKDSYPWIEKIYVSMGPAGELRYPSYSPLFGWTYPQTGTLCCYSQTARESFQNYIETKYLSIATLNAEWNTHYPDWSAVQPPLHCGTFFSQYFYTTPYGRDLLTWHQETLHHHFRKMATLCGETFGKKVRMGVKLSGVHWKYHQGRLAEKATGYVDGTYLKLIRMFKEYDFDLTVTCLEMENNRESGIDNILHNIIKACRLYEVRLYGENALPVSSDYQQAWKNIHRNITHFDGFTYLRWENLFKDQMVLQRLADLKTSDNI